MRGVLPLSLALALGATGGLAFLVVRERGHEEPPREQAPLRRTGVPQAAEPSPADGIRPYRTTRTLAEDLRDALGGDEAAVDRAFWQVSGAIESRARWTLVHMAPREGSPRVRALLVLAAGVHLPDEPVLLDYLGDREAVVRTAAALAVGHRAGGAALASLHGVRVPLGRPAPPAVAETLARSLAREDDAGARAAIEAVLRAAGLSPPR